MTTMNVKQSHEGNADSELRNLLFEADNNLQISHQPVAADIAEHLRSIQKSPNAGASDDEIYESVMRTGPVDNVKKFNDWFLDSADVGRYQKVCAIWDDASIECDEKTVDEYLKFEQMINDAENEKSFLPKTSDQDERRVLIESLFVEQSKMKLELHEQMASVRKQIYNNGAAYNQETGERMSRLDTLIASLDGQEPVFKQPRNKERMKAVGLAVGATAILSSFAKGTGQSFKDLFGEFTASCGDISSDANGWLKSRRDKKGKGADKAAAPKLDTGKEAVASTVKPAEAKTITPVVDPDSKKAAKPQVNDKEVRPKKPRRSAQALATVILPAAAVTYLKDRSSFEPYGGDTIKSDAAARKDRKTRLFLAGALTTALIASGFAAATEHSEGNAARIAATSVDYGHTGYERPGLQQSDKVQSSKSGTTKKQETTNKSTKADSSVKTQTEKLERRGSTIYEDAARLFFYEGYNKRYKSVGSLVVRIEQLNGFTERPNFVNSVTNLDVGTKYKVPA